MFMIRSAALLTACLAAFAAQVAVAQQPAPTPAAVEVPPSTCKDPGFVPIDKASPEMGRFQKRVDEYKVCVQAYVQANRVKSNEFEVQARAYADAANKSIDEYNTYVNGLNDATKTTKSGATKN